MDKIIEKYNKKCDKLFRYGEKYKLSYDTDNKYIILDNEKYSIIALYKIMGIWNKNTNKMLWGKDMIVIEKDIVETKEYSKNDGTIDEVEEYIYNKNTKGIIKDEKKDTIIYIEIKKIIKS